MSKFSAGCDFSIALLREIIYNKSKGLEERKLVKGKRQPQGGSKLVPAIGVQRRKP
jgi:hypothetical protein